MWETLEARQMMSVAQGFTSILPYIESQTTSIEDRDKIISNDIQRTLSATSNVQKTLADTNNAVISKIR
jgi:hypothetical protein